MSVTVARIADTVRCRQLTPPFVAGSLLPPHSDVVAHCRVRNAGHVRGLRRPNPLIHSPHDLRYSVQRLRCTGLADVSNPANRQMQPGPQRLVRAIELSAGSSGCGMYGGSRERTGSLATGTDLGSGSPYCRRRRSSLPICSSGIGCGTGAATGGGSKSASRALYSPAASSREHPPYCPQSSSKGIEAVTPALVSLTSSKYELGASATPEAT